MSPSSISLRALKTAMRALPAAARRGTVDLAGTNNHSVWALKFISLAGEGPSELTERDVVPADGLGMRETKLLIGGSDNADARLRQIVRFLRTNREADRRRVDNDETVAAIGDVDFERAQ